MTLFFGLLSYTSDPTSNMKLIVVFASREIRLAWYTSQATWKVSQAPLVIITGSHNKYLIMGCSRSYRRQPCLVSYRYYGLKRGVLLEFPVNTYHRLPWWESRVVTGSITGFPRKYLADQVSITAFSVNYHRLLEQMQVWRVVFWVSQVFFVLSFYLSAYKVNKFSYGRYSYKRKQANPLFEGKYKSDCTLHVIPHSKINRMYSRLELNRFSITDISECIQWESESKTLKCKTQIYLHEMDNI